MIITSPVLWDDLFLSIACTVATKSKDPSTKVGAVLVSPDKRQLSIGYNGLPPGCPDHEEYLSVRDTRLLLTVHAEVNAILQCHTRPAGWTLYCTHHPCKECSKSISAVQIKRVVCFDRRGRSDLGYTEAKDVLARSAIELDLKCLPPSL